MPALFFDVVTLRSTGLRLPTGETRTFADLKAASGTLRLYARQLTIESVPDRSMNLAADQLLVSSGVFAGLSANARSVRIVATEIVGQLSVVCAGRTGEPGAPGANGVATKTKFVVTDPTTKPPLRELALAANPTPGKQGGNGGPGQNGGTVRVWYLKAAQTPTVAAPGGAGGARGKGGTGGAGNAALEVPKAPDGLPGNPGPAGLNGTVERLQFTNHAQMWARWAAEAVTADVPAAWAAHRLEVAEFHFRTGTDDGYTEARKHLDLLVNQPRVADFLPRINVLLQRLIEHVTFCGLPRDMDIPADVAFIGQDNAQLLSMARQMVSHAEILVGKEAIELRFADFLRNAAAQADNTLAVADARAAQAKAGLDVAMASTDLAKGRVKNLDQKVSEIKGVLEKELEENTSPFAVFTQILDVGVAITQIAVGVGTGVGAVVEVARGFPTLEKTVNGATGMFDLIKDVKKELNSGSLKKFKTALKDVKGAAEKVYLHTAKLIDELDGIKSTHPDARIRELAGLQRERVLLVQEQAMHTQMEKEAQLGIAAAAAEKSAITANAALSRALERDIRNETAVDIDDIMSTIRTALRQVLDALAVRVFATIRAREIYLALDPTSVIGHDIGMLHPDREQMLPEAVLLSTLRKDIDNRALPIIQWSSLVDDVIASNDLSRGPISFSFSTQDPTMVQALRTARRVGLYIPVEDLFEEDGSQIFETKFDGVSVILRGAKLPPNTTTETIRLRQLGRWSVRRRPELPQNPNGIVKEFVLPAQAIFPACRAVPGGVEANLAVPADPRAEPPFSLWGRGIAGDWELADNKLDLTALTGIEVVFHTRALSRTAAGPTGEVTRTLRPLPGGLPVMPPRTFPVPVPPRLAGLGYGYRQGVGSVTAVGAVLV